MYRTSSPTPSCLLPKSEPLVVSICSSQDCLDTPRLPEDEVLIFQLGTAGLIYGGAAGVIRSPNPMIHSLSCGIHWFACGSAFWCMWRHPKLISLMSNLYLGTGLRSNIIKHHYQDKAEGAHVRECFMRWHCRWKCNEVDGYHIPHRKHTLWHRV
jgi:hypothetical protein